MAKSNFGDIMGTILGGAALIGLAALSVAAAQEAAEAAEAERVQRDRLTKEADALAKKGDYRGAAALRKLAAPAPADNNTPVGDKVARARELRSLAADMRAQGHNYWALTLEEDAANLLR